MISWPDFFKNSGGEGSFADKKMSTWWVTEIVKSITDPVRVYLGNTQYLTSFKKPMELLNYVVKKLISQKILFSHVLFILKEFKIPTHVDPMTHLAEINDSVNILNTFGSQKTQTISMSIVWMAIMEKISPKIKENISDQSLLTPGSKPPQDMKAILNIIRDAYMLHQQTQGGGDNKDRHKDKNYNTKYNDNNPSSKKKSNECNWGMKCTRSGCNFSHPTDWVRPKESKYNSEKKGNNTSEKK